MKALFIFFATAAVFSAGCATQKGTKEDYFGYNNSPTIPESTEKPASPSKPKRSTTPPDTTVPPTAASAITAAPDDDWVNPMTQEDVDPQEDNLDETSPQAATNVVYRSYSAPQYVPVVVPWWDSYSGWMGGCYSRPVVVVRYRNWYWGWNTYCDWYSPYYDYHPWYGGYFSYYRPRYYGWNYGYWRPWHHYPIYSYGHPFTPAPHKPNTVRSWGPSRGEPAATSGSVRGTTVTPTPVSSTPAIRNERGQVSGSTQTRPTTSGTSTTTGPTLRNERGNSSTTPQQSGTQHPLHRSETTPAGTSPKSTTTATPSEAPVRHERSTKDATPQPRSEPRPASSTGGSSSPRQERSSSSAPAASPAPRTTPAPSAAPSTPTTNSARGTRKP